MAILTLTGQYGSGFMEIGRAVADSLGYDYVDRQKMLEDLGEADKQWQERAKEYDMHCPTVWERFDWSYMAFKALIQHVHLKHAARDKVVLMGLGGNFLLKDVPFALKVGVIAPKDVRIERIVQKEEMDKKTAEWLTEKTDHDCSCYVHALYGKKWHDHSAYDVVFDTSVKTKADIVGEIQALIAEKEKLDTPEARKNLETLVRAARVKATIFLNKDFFVPTLEVIPDKDGSLAVNALVHHPEEKERLERAVRDMAVGVPVKFHLHYR